jgi:hypothetical protein
MRRIGILALLIVTFFVLAIPRSLPAAPDPRFDVAESYLRHVSTGEYRKAFELLDWKITFEEFVTRIEASNQGFADSLREQGITLVSKKIDRVDPMTFEDQYIIVAVRSQIVGKRGEAMVQDTAHYQVYFRFNGTGRIDLVHSIGEGWIC